MTVISSIAPVAPAGSVLGAAQVRDLERSLDRVVEWVRRHDYKGFEPADGNASPLHQLTGQRVWPMRVLQQVVLRAPVNIRPLIGIRPHGSAIGRGYMAWAYVLMCRRSMSPSMAGEAAACLDWLIAHRAEGHAEFCWGDPYEYATRSGRRPFGAPLLIWTALIGQAFLDAYEVLGHQKYCGVAQSIGRWMLALPAERTSTGLCLSYVTFRQSSIHNSNAMGAAFLARLGALTGDPQVRSVARESMAYTCTRQRADGSWLYAEEAKYHWVDNFHTGYNLSALKTYRAASGDHSFDRQLALGMAFYRRHFFEADWRPKYFHDRLQPVDIQCAAQSIETLASHADTDPECLDEALRVAKWTIANLQATDGHFCYRHNGWKRVSTPMLHWGQGTMSKALASLLLHAEAHA